jgi:hypothetical protein
VWGEAALVEGWIATGEIKESREGFLSSGKED